MIKEKHRKGNTYIYECYEEIPASLSIKVHNDLEQMAAAIVAWKVIINGENYYGETVEDLKEFINNLNFEYKLIVFNNDCEYLYYFIKEYFNCYTFDVGGKGIGSITLDEKIEIRDVNFIGTDRWQKFSNRETLVEQLYDFAIYYWNNIAYHNKKMSGDESILGKAPLTLQQVVSNKMKALMTKEDKEFVHSLWPASIQGYKIAMHNLYMGGYCDKAEECDVTETCGHVDFKTSYVARMLTEYYPMSAFKVESITKLYDSLKTKCCIMYVTYTNLKYNRLKYLTKKKALVLENATFDESFKIVTAEKLTVVINELDFDLINSCYTFDACYVEKLFVADRGALPKYVRQVAEECYLAKETKTGIDRTWSKLMTEIVYGATVKNLYNIDAKKWSEIVNDQFLSPYWGIWTSAHARYALMTTALLLGSDFLYSDTDSLYYKNPYLHVALIDSHNRDRMAKMELYCLKNNLPFENFKYLGSFTYEDNSSKNHCTIQKFKSLGPKTYMYWGKEIGLTTKIAGYKKQYEKNGKLVNVWEHTFDNVKDLFKAFEKSTKLPDVLKKTQSFDEEKTIIYEGKKFNAKSGIVTYYVVVRDSIKERFEDCCEAENLAIEKAKAIGKEVR